MPGIFFKRNQRPFDVRDLLCDLNTLFIRPLNIFKSIFILNVDFVFHDDQNIVLDHEKLNNLS